LSFGGDVTLSLVSAGRDDLTGLRVVVLLVDLRRDSLSADGEGTLTTSTLLDDDDFSPKFTICDEYTEFKFDFPLPEVLLCFSPLLFALVLALCFVPRTTLSSSSQSSMKAARGFLVSEPIVKYG
jgi:hypothetical protein